MEHIEGIVLRKINYKESSNIIFVYTNHGLVSVLVHGSNKLKSPYLNLVRVFSYVRLFVSGKDLKTLRDGEVIKHFEEISLDLERYAYGLHLMGLVHHFSQYDYDHEKLYQFLLKIINALNDVQNYAAYVMMFELKLLYLLGVQPLLKHCVFCDQQSNLSFSVNDGGMVCENHGGQGHFNKQILETMIYLYYFDMQKDTMKPIEVEYLIGLRKLIDQYYAYHLNYKSKSRQMIHDVLGY